MQILRHALALARRLRGPVRGQPASLSVGWERPMPDHDFEWILGALAAAHGLAFDGRLLATSYPTPRSRGDLIAAAQALGIELAPLVLAPASLVETTGPRVAFARSEAASRAAREAPPGFEPLASDSLRFTIHVDGAAAIADLLAMTPHLYRASAEGRARAAALTALTMTVDVRLARYRRLPG